MKNILLITGIVALFAVRSATAGTITVHDGFTTASALADFLAASTGTDHTETFDVLNHTPGVTITEGGYSHYGYFRIGGVNPIGEDYIFSDYLRGPEADRYTTFAFNPGTYSFGGDWFLGINGFGLGISINVGGATLTHQINDDSDGHFWGFTSDVPIESVVLSAGTQGGFSETYKMDNLRFSTLAVPESGSTASFLGIAIVLLGLASRRFK
jgi:hypothetical protein